MQSPHVLLRLGACCFELGDEENAIQYLLWAYRMEGEEIFCLMKKRNLIDEEYQVDIVLETGN